ncbi:Putative DNA-binding protein in cluster with Type I restriction-modification system, partial [hydrothermal vent metagenome]
MSQSDNTSQFIIYQTEDGQTKLDVRFQDETVWLTQLLMAELFQTTPENILMHLKNIYKEAELDEQATTKDFLVVRQEGKRQVTRKLKHYNLDAIISVGYRVKSRTATRFRQWATRQLREY